MTSRLETAFSPIGAEDERDARRKEAEAKIRVHLRDSGLLESTDSPPLVIDDIVMRDPYRQNEDEDAALDRIYALDRTGRLMEFSETSKVVAALKKFEVYRVYCRAEDSVTRSKLEAIIQGECK